MVQGYRLVFSTIRGRKHHGVQLHEWLIAKAKDMAIDGVTVLEALEGYGREKKLHSANFFELADQPLEIIMLADEESCNKLLEIIKQEGSSIFYSKSAAEFGFTA
jgi:PII-like signaling protein